MVSLNLLDAAGRGASAMPKKKKFTKKETELKKKPPVEKKKTRSGKEVREKMYGSKED